MSSAPFFKPDPFKGVLGQSLAGKAPKIAESRGTLPPKREPYTWAAAAPLISLPGPAGAGLPDRRAGLSSDRALGSRVWPWVTASKGSWRPIGAYRCQ